jgi:hypothetical protein
MMAVDALLLGVSTAVTDHVVETVTSSTRAVNVRLCGISWVRMPFDLKEYCGERWDVMGISRRTDDIMRRFLVPKVKSSWVVS